MEILFDMPRDQSKNYSTCSSFLSFLAMGISVNISILLIRAKLNEMLALGYLKLYFAQLLNNIRKNLIFSILLVNSEGRVFALISYHPYPYIC